MIGPSAAPLTPLLNHSMLFPPPIPPQTTSSDSDPAICSLTSTDLFLPTILLNLASEHTKISALSIFLQYFLWGLQVKEMRENNPPFLRNGVCQNVIHMHYGSYSQISMSTMRLFLTVCSLKDAADHGVGDLDMEVLCLWVTLMKCSEE